jgi:FMN phosphatase YigB (HAD superfamily)
MTEILTDCDGVLLDWESSFHRWMKIRGYNQVHHGYYEIERMYDMTRDRGKQLIVEFNNSSWMGFLPAFRDAKSGVAALQEHGYQFVCITSLSLDPYTKDVRWINLKNVFGNEAFQDLICLDTGGDKDQALAPYKDSGLWWIEDKASNASLGADMGLKSILVNHAHNQYHQDSRLHRVDNWKEIVKLVEREEV